MRRLLISAFVLSTLVHLFGGALWAHANHLIAQIMQRLPEQQQREQEIATSDAIHLEKRTVPRPARANRTRPAPQRVLPPQQRAAPRVAAAARLEIRRPFTKIARPAPSAAPEIAHHAPQAPPHVDKPAVAAAAGAHVRASAAARSAREAAFTAAQLAKFNAQFAQAIAASHMDLATIQKRSEQRPVATKRYPMQFTGMQATLQRGQGYIEPTAMGQRIGGTVLYYTHYTYMWPDGHLEDDDIPWPFRYPVRHDLFAMHTHLIPLQLPPPGFHLTRPLKPFLAGFLQRAGRG